MAEDTQLHMEKWTRLLVIVSTFLVLVIFIGVIVRLGMEIHHTILLFSLGALLAYALDPLVEGLRRRPEWSRVSRRLPRRMGTPAADDGMISRPFAISLVFIGLLVLVGLGAYGLSKPLAKQIRLVSDQRQFAGYKARADTFLHGTDNRLLRLGVHSHFDQYLRNPASIPPSVQEFARNSEQDVLGFVKDLIVSTGESVVVLLISLYLLIYCGEIRTKVNAQMPENLRIHAEVWEEDVNRILGGFVRGQIIIALGIGAASAVACLALGIHIWLIIGIFVAIASLIPVFGPYIGAIPAIIAALVGPTHFSSNVAAALVLLAFFIVINEVGSKILYPRLVGHAIGLHEVMVLFVIFAGLEIDGIPGVLFAAPVTAIAMVSLIHLYRFWLELPDSLLSARNEAVAAGAPAKASAGGAGSDGKSVSDMKKTVG